jgi:hypothetical protein
MKIYVATYEDGSGYLYQKFLKKRKEPKIGLESNMKEILNIENNLFLNGVVMALGPERLKVLRYNYGISSIKS